MTLTRHLLHLRLSFGSKRCLQPQFHRGSLRVHFMAVRECHDSEPRVWVVSRVPYVDLQQAHVENMAFGEASIDGIMLEWYRYN